MPDRDRARHRRVVDGWRTGAEHRPQQHRPLFSYVGGLGFRVWGNAANFPKTYATIAANADEANKKLKLVWVGLSTEDSAFAGVERAFPSF